MGHSVAIEVAGADICMRQVATFCAAVSPTSVCSRKGPRLQT